MQIGYLDPASGSIIASVLVGGTAAIGVAAKTARSRIAGVFKRRSADGEATAEDPAVEDVNVESDA